MRTPNGTRLRLVTLACRGASNDSPRLAFPPQFATVILHRGAASNPSSPRRLPLKLKDGRVTHSFQDLLGRAVGGDTLDFDQASTAIELMISGEVSDSQIALFLSVLAERGETIHEVAGAAAALRRLMTPIRTTRSGLVDTCGTGGGGSQTFNISTTAAIVAAAAGAAVAKHGNRSVTSRSGSADVLQALGVNVGASVPQVEACLDVLGLCFCFAPLQHPAMKNVSAVRKQLGIRTLFNIVGPLANPAGAEHQLLGAGRPEIVDLLAGSVHRLGTRRTLVVHGEDGMGDVTLAGSTRVIEVTPEGLREFRWTPTDFGIARDSTEAMTVEGPEESAAVVRSVLAGERGAPRDIVVLNAAAALIAAGLETAPEPAALRAAAAIDTGAAQRKLEDLVICSHAAV